MGLSICCMQAQSAKSLSLIENDGQAGGIATSFARKKSSDIDVRVLWPNDQEGLTSDLSISKTLDKLRFSNALQPNNSTKSEHEMRSACRGSVELHLDNQLSSKSTHVSREKISTGGLLEALMGGVQFSSSTPTSQRKDTKKSASTSWEAFPMTKVLPNLWIGTFDDASNETLLKLNGITHILSLVGHRSSIDWVEHKHYPMDDHGKTDIKSALEEISEFIKIGQKGDNKLLVHCQSGQNRSAVVIIAFLMIMNKKTLYRAHRELKKLRPIVQVNVHYAKQLMKLEQELFNGVNSLPSNWMEGSFDSSAGDINYKHENLTTSRHNLLLLDIEEK